MLHLKPPPLAVVIYFTEAMRLDPSDPDSYRERGTARSAQGDEDGAISDFAEVERLTQKPPYNKNNPNLGS